MNQNARGFTVVELLIVIVVIGILAAVSIVAYNNVAAKGRDAQRLQDIKTVAKALEMYYADNGQFPTGYCGQSYTPACPSPKKINAAWSTTSDGSWSVLESALVPKYISALPKDPAASVTGDPAISGGYNYDYVRVAGTGCAPVDGRSYIVVYRLESQDQKRDVSGECVDGAYVFNYGTSSEYAVVK